MIERNINFVKRYFDTEQSNHLSEKAKLQISPEYWYINYVDNGLSKEGKLEVIKSGKWRQFLEKIDLPTKETIKMK